MEVALNLDKDVKYVGNTDEERRLNKELLSTLLEINAYQDSYDVMHGIDDIKAKIEETKVIMCEEYLPEPERQQCKGYIEALEWVLNGSQTKEEKLNQIPRPSREEIEKFIKENNEKYKQMSITDFGVEYED